MNVKPKLSLDNIKLLKYILLKYLPEGKCFKNSHVCEDEVLNIDTAVMEYLREKTFLI